MIQIKQDLVNDLKTKIIIYESKLTNIKILAIAKLTLIQKIKERKLVFSKVKAK